MCATLLLLESCTCATLLLLESCIIMESRGLLHRPLIRNPDSTVNLPLARAIQVKSPADRMPCQQPIEAA